MSRGARARSPLVPQEGEEEKKRLSDRRHQIQEELTRLQTRVTSLREEEGPLKAKLKAKSDDLAKLRSRAAQEEEDMRKNVNEVAQDLDRFLQMQESIVKLRADDKVRSQPASPEDRECAGV